MSIKDAKTVAEVDFLGHSFLVGASELQLRTKVPQIVI